MVSCRLKKITCCVQDVSQYLLIPDGLRFCRRGLFILLLVTFGCAPTNHQVSTSSQESQEVRRAVVNLSPAPSVKQDTIEQHSNMEPNNMEPSDTEPISQQELQRPKSSPELLAKGEQIYKEHCARCHGDRGDGRGELADELSPPPLDFTAGVFKFRSTPTGQLPTQEDLFRTVSVGVAGTSMSDYSDLPEPDRRAVVEYVMTFTPRFREESLSEPIPAPPSRMMTPEAVERGQELYTQMFCTACHGEKAHGDGPLARSLSDSNGRNIQPADLTKKRLKSGKGPDSIYRSLMTGLDGTPMPSFGDSLTRDEAWDIALYLTSLSKSGEAQ